jgi:hypothetical protein
MLAFAMIQALPESFNTIKQALWLHTPLKLIDVSSAVQAEWSRRNNGGIGALKAQIGFKKQGNNDRKSPPKDIFKYCQNHKARGHDTKDCFGVSPAYLRHHAFNDNRPQGRDTTSANLAQIAQNLSIQHERYFMMSSLQRYWIATCCQWEPLLRIANGSLIRTLQPWWIVTIATWSLHNATTVFIQSRQATLSLQTQPKLIFILYKIGMNDWDMWM